MNPLKGLQGSVQTPYAGLFFSDDISVSHYLPREYSKGMPHHYDWITIPEDSTTLNDANKSRFRIHRDYHLLGKTHLIWTQAAITGDVTTHKEFVDFWPLLSIDHIVIKSDKAVQRDIIIPGIVLVSQFFEFTGPERTDLDRINHYCYGYITQANRKILATGIQTPRVPLDHLLFYSRQESKYLPLSQLENDLIIEVFWNPLSSIITYSGATPPTSLKSDRQLRCEVFTVVPEVLDIIGDMTKKQGIIEYYRDYVTNTYYIDSTNNTPTWLLDLQPFNCDVVYFCVLIRYQDEVETLATNTGFSNRLPWVSHQFRTQTQVFQGPILRDETIYEYNNNKLNFPYPVNVLYHYNEDNRIESDNSLSGSKNYRTYNTPYLEIFPDATVNATISAGGGRPVRIDVIAACHNFITLKNRTVGDNTIEFKKLFDF